MICLTQFTIFNRPFEFLTSEDQWVKLYNYMNQYFFSNVWGQYAVLVLMAVLAGFLLALVLHGTAKKAVNILTLLAYCGALALLFLVSRETARGFRMFALSDYLTDTGFHETRILIEILNGLFFIPFGILLRKASGKGHAILNVLLVVLAAGGIEVAQYAFSRGYTAVDDAAVYIVGGFLGLILASPFCLISEYLEERRKKKKRRKSYALSGGQKTGGRDSYAPDDDYYSRRDRYRDQGNDAYGYEDDNSDYRYEDSRRAADTRDYGYEDSYRTQDTGKYSYAGSYRTRDTGEYSYAGSYRTQDTADYRYADTRDIEETDYYDEEDPYEERYDYDRREDWDDRDSDEEEYYFDEYDEEDTLDDDNY